MTFLTEKAFIVPKKFAPDHYYIVKGVVVSLVQYFLLKIISINECIPHK